MVIDELVNQHSILRDLRLDLERLDMRQAALTIGCLFALNTYSNDSLPQLPSIGEVGSEVYVSASRVNLREAATTGSAVLAKPVTNSAAKLTSKNGDWCKVTMLSDQTRGFVACKWLTAKPLSLDWVESQLSRVQADKTLDPQVKAASLIEWAARAFWIAPTLSRWAFAGKSLEDALIDDKLRNQQWNEMRAVRFKVPGFEAMKQRLAHGIVVDANSIRTAQGQSLDIVAQHIEPVKSALTRIDFPAAKPSFFSANDILVVLPAERFGSMDYPTAIQLIDALSATNQSTFHAVVTGGAEYVLNDGAHYPIDDAGWHFRKVVGAMDEITGIWDVGGLDVTFDQQSMLNGVTANGAPKLQMVKKVGLHIGYDSPCSYSPTSVNIQSYPVQGAFPPDKALVTWAGKAMPNGTSAQAEVKSHLFRGKDEYETVRTYELDLDSDAIPDFMVWQGRYVPQLSAEGLWETVLGNINGEWRLLTYSEDADCT